MKKIIISDTTTLIVLEKQQHLFLLCKLFEQVIIPVAVYQELLVGFDFLYSIKINAGRKIMIAVNLNIRDEMYEKIMYFLKSLPKQDIQIVSYEKIEEINPSTLPKDHFDYMSQEEMDELDRMSKMVKDGNLSEFKNFEDIKNEIQNSSL